MDAPVFLPSSSSVGEASASAAAATDVYATTNTPAAAADGSANAFYSIGDNANYDQRTQQGSAITPPTITTFPPTPGQQVHDIHSNEYTGPIDTRCMEEWNNSNSTDINNNNNKNESSSSSLLDSASS